MTAMRSPVMMTIIGLYGVFVIQAMATGFQPGIDIWDNFLSFFIQMLKLLPCVFVLIGLFEVWVKRETVERHLGRESGVLSYLWAILLAGTTIGGVYVALPVAFALRSKGARLGVVLAYVSASAICRIPMTLFEAGFLGWRFTMVRFAASLPLVLVSSALLGVYLEKRGYRMPDES